MKASMTSACENLGSTALVGHQQQSRLWQQQPVRFVLHRVLVFLKLWFLSFVHFQVLFLEEDEILPLRFTIYLGKPKCTWSGQGLLESTSPEQN